MLTLLLPEILLAITITALLCRMLSRQSETEPRLFMAVAACLLVAGAVVSVFFGPATLFYASYRVDLLSQGFKVILAASLLFTVLASRDQFSIQANRLPEYYFFLLTGTLGMMMMTSAADLLTLYVSLELSSYSLYLLTALRDERRTTEASVKYVIIGAAVSGIMLWGLSLMAGVSGTFLLAGMAQNAPALLAEPAFAAGLALTLFAVLFKLSAFPVHAWAPDAYEAASTPVTAFLATASKAAAVAVMIRLLMLTGLTPGLTAAFGALAVASMTLGNAAALVQRDVKRLLAYSSVAQAGYLLVGLAAVSGEGFSSAFFYALAYAVMNAGAFTVVLAVARASANDNPKLSDFDGLAERSPLLGLLLLVSLLSLAGIPPLAGFTGKWILFSAAMDKGRWLLVLWAVLNSVVSLFYYLTLVKHAYLEKPKTLAPVGASPRVRVLAIGLCVAIVLLGLFPNFFVTFAQQAVVSAATPW